MRVLAIALSALLAAGCAAPLGEGAHRSKKGASDDAVRESIGLRMEDLDFGDDWLEDATTASGRSPGAAAAAAGADEDGGVRTSYWGVLLHTFSNGDHAAAAANMIRGAATIDPRLARAHANTTPRGSSVLYGVYESPDDPAAQRDLEWIKALKIGPRTVFPRAMLTRVTPEPARRRLRPIDLLSVRRMYPNVDPLYTLQVAVWGEFDGRGGATAEDRRRHADAQVRELRSRGYEAYVHHDPDKRLSMVTVGLFDKNAVDPQSGINSPEVERLLREFPAHLVNGAPLEEPIDPRRPSLGTRTQAPKLVLVPRL